MSFFRIFSRFPFLLKVSTDDLSSDQSVSYVLSLKALCVPFVSCGQEIAGAEPSDPFDLCGSVDCVGSTPHINTNNVS